LLAVRRFGGLLMISAGFGDEGNHELIPLGLICLCISLTEGGR
jgi:hypothetical protein